MAGEEEPKSDTTRFLESAKDFSFEQKLSVVQSILAKIPREQQRPWNEPVPHQNQVVKSSERKEPRLNLAGGDCLETSGLKETRDNGELGEKHFTTVIDEHLKKDEDVRLPKYQAPPLIDPYEKSMRYYEKHMILNHFQHMTAKLVLERPENTLGFMMNWCKDMQKKTEEEKLKAKTLYEHNVIDVYDKDISMPLDQDEPKSPGPSNTKHQMSSLSGAAEGSNNSCTTEPSKT